MKDDALQAFLDLWKAYLYLQCWGLPEFEQLVTEERHAFAALVRDGRALAYVESCKEHVVRVYPDIPNSWLTPLGAASIRDGHPLPQAQRDSLRQIGHEMWPIILRLSVADEADRVGAVKGSTVGAKPGETRSITELAAEHGISAGTISRWAREKNSSLIAKMVAGRTTEINVNEFRKRLAASHSVRQALAGRRSERAAEKRQLATMRREQMLRDAKKSEFYDRQNAPEIPAASCAAPARNKVAQKPLDLKCANDAPVALRRGANGNRRYQ